MSSTSDAGKTNPEPTSEKKPKPVKNSIRRWSIGTTMTVQIITAAVLLIGINIIVFHYGQQHDLSRQKNIKLSEETLKNLKSDPLTKRTRNVKITAVINSNQFELIKRDSQEDVVEHIKVKLQEYVDKANGKIEVEFVNALVEPGKLHELSEQYGIKFTTSVLLIDARFEDTPSPQTLEKLRIANPNIPDEKLIASFEKEMIGRHVRVLPAEELFIADIDRNYNDSHFVALWKDEAEITTNIMRAIEGEAKKIYFLYDKCQLDSKRGGPSPWEYVRNIYRGQNIQLENISLSNLPIENVNGRAIKRIPKDADGIALISPQVDFTDEELLSLSEYWELRDSSSILITLDPEVHLPRLNSYLLRSQIKPNKDRIIRKEGNQILVNPEVEFLQGPEVNGDLSGLSTTFSGASQSIEIRQKNDNSLVEAFPLIRVGPDWWGETQFGNNDPEYNPKADTPKPLYLAAAVTRGQINDQLTKPLVSKLVVIGNSEFLSKNIRDEQQKFISQIGAWLVGREPLMNLPQQPNYRRKVFIAAAHKDLMNQIFIFFLPAAALIITGFVWNIRRS